MLKLVAFVTLLSGIIAADIPTLLLNDGLRIPIVGFGAMGATEQAVRDAIAAGYRHIDTSLNYGDSELLIAKVLKDVFAEGKIKRSDLFITTKLETDYHARTRVPEGIKTSLKRLGIDYLDLYLVHSPSATAGSNIDITETWNGMIDVQKSNLTRSIGVSNFNEAQIDKIVANSTVKPVTNQVISNPYRNQKKLLDYLNKNNITLTAWSPVGGRSDANLLKDTKLIDIGKRHNVSSAQVALRYQVQRNVIVIPKANTPNHIKENLDLFSFTLTEQDIKDVEALNKVAGY